MLTSVGRPEVCTRRRVMPDLGSTGALLPVAIGLPVAFSAASATSDAGSTPNSEPVLGNPPATAG